ncbi:hypothetical protein [Sorangium sp. So ce1335]|uniref:hypothetical protein n=1 Tax=Sorangium sp. So ce1335 TaxID=3133335 RepID=UPI003F5FD3BD
MSTGPVERALSYHGRTKHHLDRDARALGYLDWSTQPGGPVEDTRPMTRAPYEHLERARREPAPR